MSAASTNALSEDACFELEQWPDGLIQAVAAQAPELLRSGDPFAYREQGLAGHARERALMSLEEEDLRFADLDSFTQVVRERLFRQFDVDGESWFVAHWQGGPDQSVDLPIEYESLSQEQWPDELIAAVGQQAPELLRTTRGESWALKEAAFPRFADYWLFEGDCDSLLYPYIDRARYHQELRATFSEIEVGGERWYAQLDDSDNSDTAAAHTDTQQQEALALRGWPDELVAAVAATWPQVFRTSDYETICAACDEQLRAVVAAWAFGLEEKVKEAGGLEAWVELVVSEDFRPVDVASQRWWVYIHDWKRTLEARTGHEPAAPSQES